MALRGSISTHTLQEKNWEAEAKRVDGRLKSTSSIHSEMVLCYTNTIMDSYIHDNKRSGKQSCSNIAESEMDNYMLTYCLHSFVSSYSLFIFASIVPQCKWQREYSMCKTSVITITKESNSRLSKIIIRYKNSLKILAVNLFS